MSGVQKIIKYLAVAFALFLTFSIISSIASGFAYIGNLFQDDNNNINEEFKKLEIGNHAKNLDIDIKSSSILIKTSDKFKVETSNKYIECKQDKNTIHITEKNHNWLRKNNNGTLSIYIPEDIILNNFSIESGAGEVNIEQLSTKTLNLDLGAGLVNINKLTVLSNTKIDGGAGEVNIDNSDLGNLDLDMGAGKFALTAKLHGKSEIDHGLGEIKLNLIGTKDDYQIHVDKGIGNATIDNDKINNDQTVGNGNNIIDIDGGVGNIDINFIEMRN